MAPPSLNSILYTQAFEKGRAIYILLTNYTSSFPEGELEGLQDYTSTLRQTESLPSPSSSPMGP